MKWKNAEKTTKFRWDSNPRLLNSLDRVRCVNQLCQRTGNNSVELEADLQSWKSTLFFAALHLQQFLQKLLWQYLKNFPKGIYRGIPQEIAEGFINRIATFLNTLQKKTSEDLTTIGISKKKLLKYQREPSRNSSSNS